MYCEGEAMAEESALSAKREEEIKERGLDESSKKAETSRGPQFLDNKTSKKTSHNRSFPKLGILLIIIAIIGLISIDNTPWAYIGYEEDYGYVETPVYRNFKNADSEHQTILDLFGSPYYIGVSTDDFTYAPTSAYYGFISLIILGVILTIFGIWNKIRNFSLKTFTIFHFIFATATIIPSTFIVLSVIKFLGAHFLLYHNTPLISNSNIILLFPAVYIVIVLGSIIIKLAFTVIRMDFNELQKIKEIGTSGQSFSHHIYGGRTQ